MESFLMVLMMIPRMLCFGLILGCIALFSVFGFLHVLPVALMLVCAVVFHCYHKDVVSKILFASSVIGTWLSLIVLFISSFLTPVGQAKYFYWETLPSDARAGFPFASVEIPPSALGSDIVPVGMWPGIFANHIFWLTISVLLVALIFRYRKEKASKLPWSVMAFLCVVFSFIPLLYNLALFKFWFD
jgi:hypothetical protein